MDGAVLACLEFYAVDAREPDTQFLAAIATIGSQLARVIERKRALDEARGNEQKLNSILGALQEVVWSMDPQTGRLLYLNAAAEKVAGCSIGELLAKPRLWRRMIHREDRQAVFSSIRKLRKDGKMIHEFRLVLADGEIRTVENRVQVVCNAGGAARRIDGTLTDITSRKAAEQQLRDHALRLQSMSHQLLEAQESERNRIARELHDQAGQLLTVLKIKLEMLERKAGAEAVAPEIAECTQLAADTLDQLRDMMLELRPPPATYGSH